MITTDRAAFEFAIEAVRALDSANRDQIDGKLARESIETVGKNAASLAQVYSLSLRPWHNARDVDPSDVAHAPEHQRARRRFRSSTEDARGWRFEVSPDPLRAIAEAERGTASAK